MYLAKDFPNNINDVRNVTMLNLASVYSMGGEFDKAKQLLKQVSTLFWSLFLTPVNGELYEITIVCLSIRLSVRPSVRRISQEPFIIFSWFFVWS